MRTMGKLIAGLAAIAALFGALTTSAFASGWLQCAEGTIGTKYTTNQCSAASGTGKFEWQETTSAAATRGHETFALRDTKVPILGTVEIKCSDETFGSVGPAEIGKITEIGNVNCAPGKNCEAVQKNAEPVGLPWQTELVDEELGARDMIKAETGSGAGWAATCRVLGTNATDQCTTMEGSTSVENKVTGGELLVLATAESKSAKSNCTVGGGESGETPGTSAVLLSSGAALRVTIIRPLFRATLSIPVLAVKEEGKVVVKDVGSDEIKVAKEGLSGIDLEGKGTCLEKKLVTGARCEFKVKRTAAGEASDRIGVTSPVESGEETVTTGNNGK